MSSRLPLSPAHCVSYLPVHAVAVHWPEQVCLYQRKNYPPWLKHTPGPRWSSHFTETPAKLYPDPVRAESMWKQNTTGQGHTDTFLKHVFVNKHVNISSPSSPRPAPSENSSSGSIEFQDHEALLRVNEINGETFCFPHMKERNRREGLARVCASPSCAPSAHQSVKGYKYVQESWYMEQNHAVNYTSLGSWFLA